MQIGSTAGIGKEYADYLAKMGMSVLIISRSESKLKEQVAELQATYKGAEIKYIAYDYTDMGPAREEFYRKLDKECGVLDKSGGIGLLINNVGIANQYPQLLVELSDKEVSDMINCNIDSCVFMTRAVLKYMVPRNSGAIIN
ncbi:hsd17b12a, partial [Symbiodinium microadriaticum]